MPERDTPEVLKARRALTDAIHNMHADQRVRISLELAQQLDKAWDAYDAALVATSPAPAAATPKARWVPFEERGCQDGPIRVLAMDGKPMALGNLTKEQAKIHGYTHWLDFDYPPLVTTDMKEPDNAQT
jgi:hypothetical protein